MEKKTVLSLIAVTALVLAGWIAYVNSNKPEKPVGIKSVDPNEMIWIKCKDPNCAATFQMNKVAFLEYLQQNIDPMAMQQPAIPCEKCGGKTGYKALKCESCDAFFFYGEVVGDFPDKCPLCGISKTEQRRKEMAQ
jgi:hypothetical protein